MVKFSVATGATLKGAKGVDIYMYCWTSLYARDRDSKNRLTYNVFAYKKTKDD